MGIPTLLPFENRCSNLLFSDAELHAHVYWEFTVFTDGICRNIVNGKEHLVSEGMLIILGPPHAHSIQSITSSHVHRDIFISSDELITICKTIFTETLYDRISDAVTPVLLQLTPELLKELKQLFSILDAAYVQQQSSIPIKSIVHSIVVFLLGQVVMSESISHTSSVSWLSKQLLFLHQPDIFRQNTESIIKQTGYSHSQYLRKFKESTGMPLIKHLIDLRINHAKYLLKTTSKSVLEISADVGYDSINYFIRTFKHYTGVTPLQYRLQNR